MRRFKTWLVVIFIFVGVMHASMAQAALMTYTDQASFLSATNSLNRQKLDFEAISAGTVLPSGSTLGGITFIYNFGGFDMQVLDNYDTTSGRNYLGTDGDGIFLAGDMFTMNFNQNIQALGLFVISGDIILEGDFRLSNGAGGVVNSGTTDSTYGTLGDGGQVFFLGLYQTNPSQGFAAATFESGVNGGDYTFNVDDIIRGQTQPEVVPEPATMLLLGSGLIGLAGYGRKKFFKK